MKNSQKGFVVPLLIGIIALLVIGGGIYIYENKKAESPVAVNTNATGTVVQTSDTGAQPGGGAPIAPSSSITITSANLGAANSVYSQIIYVGYATKNIQTANLTAYLYNMTTGGNAAQFPLSNLGGEYWGTGSGQVSLNLNDLKNKGVIVPSGQYKVFLCDLDISDSASLEKSLCGSSQLISIASSESSGLKTYSSAQYGFSFQYPSTFVPCKDKVACVQYNSDSQATFNVSVNSSETYEDCVRMLQNDPSNGISATIQTTINGIVFEKDSSVDPAAGQRYGTESYRTYYNGACYEIDLHAFWSVQDESYPTTIYPKLEALLPTFMFTAQQTVAPIHSAPVSTSAWVTYNGSLVPITFMYPGVLSVNTKDLGSSIGNLWLTQLDEMAGTRTVPGSDLPGKIAVTDFTKVYSTLAGVETASPAKQYGFTSLTLGGESAIQVNKQNNTSTDVLYYVAHGGKVYEIIIYSPLPLEVQNLTNSLKFVQ